MKRYFLGIILVLSAFQTAFAQEGDTLRLDLEKAVRMAINENPEAKIAAMEVRVAEQQVREAYGYAYPSIDLTGNFSHFLRKPKMAFPDFEVILSNATYSILYQEQVPLENGPMTEEQYQSKLRPLENVLQSFVLSNSFETSIQATQILFNSAVFRGIGVSQVYSNTTREMLKSTVAKTVKDVKQAFYGAILTGELLTITEESLENAQKNLENVMALQKEGLVSEFDALQAEVQVENIRPMVLQMQVSHQNAKDGLKMLIGLDPASPIDIEGEIEYNPESLPSESELISSAHQDNYNIKSMEMKLELDDAIVDVERSDYWPTIAAFGNFAYAGSADDFDFQTYTSSMVGLQFSMNLFKGNQTSSKVQQAQIAKMQSEEQLKSLKNAVTMQIRNKIEELNRVKTNIAAQQRNVSLAERAYDLAETRYREGTGNQLEIQNADLALRQARTHLLQAKYDWVTAKSELDNLLGNTDPKYFRLIDELKIKN